MKRRNQVGILAIVGAISTFTWIPPTASWADQQIHGPDRQAVAYIIRQGDHIAGLEEGLTALEHAINRLKKSLKGRGSKEVERVIKDLDIQRKYYRKLLDNAAQSKEKVLVLFEGRQTVTMR